MSRQHEPPIRPRAPHARVAERSGERSTAAASPASFPAGSVRSVKSVLIRSLWRGESVTHRGLVTVVDARLYSLPEEPPPLFGAAVSDETAEWVGGWADGLVTTGRDRDAMAKTIAAVRRGGGAGKPVHVQHVLSWAPRVEDASAPRCCRS